MKLLNLKTYLLFILVISQIVSAQNTNVWKVINNKTKLENKWDGVKTHRIDLDQDALNEMVMDFDQNGESQITIPHPLGGYMTFAIKPSHIMAKGLQDKYPDIKTFKGYNSKGETVRFTITSHGLHGMVFTQDGTIMIEPEHSESTNYVSYFKSDYFKANKGKVGFYEETNSPPIENASTLKTASTNSVFQKRSIGSNLKKYRIAIAAEGEFTNLYGGKTKAIETIVTILDMINGIFEKDLGITLELIANNDALIYTTASDPYSDIEKDTRPLRSFNQEHLDNVIGFNNYDLGFLLVGNSDIGGQAALGQVCDGSQKAAAMAAINNGTYSFGLTYIANYVGHEVGHQFGAHHTFSGVGCEPLSDLILRDAYELGSGSTIMSYSGLCGFQNIENLTGVGDYFHAISIEAMLSYIDDRTEPCSTLVETGNTAPTVEIPDGGFVIPINTPFALHAKGGDADGNTLTYCWEQLDQAKKEEYLRGYDMGKIYTREELEAEGYTEAQINLFLTGQEQAVAKLFGGDGPLFRSFPPTTEDTRYFPQLEDVLAGDFTSKKEVLPFKTRDLNFVVTVRDNLGGMTNDLVSFSSTDVAGPFAVTSKLTKSSYTGLSNLKVEWDVANTNIAPVNCQKVNILYSTNGGKSFDIMVLENTDNDGSETIKLPNIATSEARIMVKAANNIFFNINDRNFIVEEGALAVDQISSNLNEIEFLYPNPVISELYIPSSLLNKIKEIKIFDLNGKNVANYYPNMPIEKLDVSTLSTGLFIMQIYTNDQILVTRKFLKK